MRALRALSAVLLLLACEGNSNPGVTIQLVDPSGDNAALDVIEGTLAVEVRQGDTVLCGDGCTTDIRGGSFELTLPIESFVDLTRLQGHITGDGVDTVGAVPPFTIAGEFLETAELPVRLVMMEPDRCEPLSLFNVSTSNRPRLVEPRRDMAVAIRRNFVLLAGGTAAAGPSNRTDFFDQIVVEMRPPLDSPGGALGPSRGLTLSEDASLVVGETAWIYERQVQAPPSAVPLTLHAGAGYASAVVRVNNTAAVIGGSGGTDEVSWFTALTLFEARRLSVPREFPAAAAGAEGVLVVGGGMGAEWITLLGDTTLFTENVPESRGGWVTASPSGRTFLAIGGSGTRTTIFRGCPACVASEGPEWTRARDGASAVRTEAGVLWIVGGDDSTLVDRVRWSGDPEMPSISPGPELSQPRAGAAVAEHASGVVFVVGGQGTAEAGMLSDAELCTPAEGLDPLN